MGSLRDTRAPVCAPGELINVSYPKIFRVINRSGPTVGQLTSYYNNKAPLRQGLLLVFTRTNQTDLVEHSIYS